MVLIIQQHFQNKELMLLHLLHYTLPSLIKVMPGLSSVLAKDLPLITVLAPAPIAFAKLPLDPFSPPSAIKGISQSLATLAHSNTAVNCGTPAPATILVTQIAPLPIPHFTQSAPAFIKSKVASLVATFPTINSTLLNLSFTDFAAFIANLECPCAISIHKTSQPASNNASALS